MGRSGRSIPRRINGFVEPGFQGSVVGLQEEGISALKQLLASMSGGMQVALLTTLTGLCSAMLISMQCHWLDRCADQLVSRIIEISATQTLSTDSEAA